MPGQGTDFFTVQFSTMASKKTEVNEETIQQSAENALQFMLTGKSPVHLSADSIKQHIEKAFEISKAFHAFDHTEAKK